MKKVFALLLALVLVLSLAACGGDSEDKTESKTESKTPCADKLEEKASGTEAGSGLYKEAWTMYSWIIKNLDSFDDPASVELGETAFYSKGTDGEYDFFLVQFRAKGAFQGKDSGYCKVIPVRLTVTDWQPTYSPSFENKSVYKTSTSLLKDAFKEYKENTYG